MSFSFQLLHLWCKKEQNQNIPVPPFIFQKHHIWKIKSLVHSLFISLCSLCHTSKNQFQSPLVSNRHFYFYCLITTPLKESLKQEKSDSDQNNVFNVFSFLKGLQILHMTEMLQLAASDVMTVLVIPSKCRKLIVFLFNV